MRLSRNSIRLRLATMAALAVAMIGALLYAGGFLLLRNGLEAELRSFAIHETEELASVVARFSDREALLAAQDRLEPFSQDTGLVSFGVLSWEGEPVAGFAGTRPQLPERWDAVIAAVHGGATPFEPQQRAGVGSVLRSAKEVGGPAGARWIVTTTVARDQVVAATRRFLLFAGLGLAVAILMSFLGAWTLVGRALQPVAVLVADAKAIANEGPSRRLEVPPEGSELEELAVLVNTMLGRTERTLARLQRFTANAGHELRTPLTRIRAEAEAALQSADPEQKSEALSSVLEEIDELKALVDALLEFAYGDAPQLANEPPLRLDELVLELCDEARELGEMRSIEVRAELEAKPCWISGNRLLLSRAIWNVISNALKFTPDGGRLEFALRAVRDGYELDVTDSGAGLGDGDPELLFEPFLKGPPPPFGPAGHGLGLSLSRAIARRHGGDWTAASLPGSGARFRLRLPAATPTTVDAREEPARVRSNRGTMTDRGGTRLAEPAG